MLDGVRAVYAGCKSGVGDGDDAQLQNAGIYSPIREHMSYLHQGEARANLRWTPYRTVVTRLQVGAERRSAQKTMQPHGKVNNYKRKGAKDAEGKL